MACDEILEGQGRVEGAVDLGIPAGFCHGPNLRLFIAVTIVGNNLIKRLRTHI